MMFVTALSAVLLAALPPVVEADQPETDVVVTARKDRDKLIRDYVRGMARAPSTEPLARFDDHGICPGVAGLSEVQNAQIVARMREVATAAGIAVSKQADCKPNTLVLIAQDKDAMVAALKQAHPVFFRQVTGEQVRLPKGKRHAVAWHLEGRRDRFNQPVPYNTLVSRYELSSPLPPSRLSKETRPVFIAAVVVIDLDSLVGLSTVQVADYAAMRTFAATDPDRQRGLDTPTILTILDAPMESEVPLTLTQWDLSYLRGLYSAAAMRAASSQRDSIGRKIGKDLDRPSREK